ncbi:MAG TPA: hypothetical protein VKF36_11800 [Syntrophorhabdales bacterium]|nr:hypothetical protein [Syntrophorhabdales bacterium]
MLKLSRKFVVLLLAHLILGASALYSEAADESERKWTSYMRGRDGTEYFYDKGAVIETPQRTLQVWRKRVFRPGAAQKEIVTFDQLACDFREEYRTLRLSVTYWDGTTKVYDKWSPWAHIYANSPEQYLVNEHCSQSYKVVPEK